ncbi:MAG: hypothetical protein O2931_04360 [Planctomycetota bacterium]|nr:hypothetical protein [Planctomycetota bacterium]MDA1178014.1 hypothetical protein [Planctomycetota bacterium]
MKITSIVATPVSVPTERACGWSWGCALGMTRTIVQVNTDEGLIGIGECSGSAAAILLDKSLGPQLVGHNVRDIGGLRKLCRMDFSDYLSGHARSC